jgi:predicted nucleotide-binding protein
MRPCTFVPLVLLLGCGKPASVEDCEKIVERITELKLQEAKVVNPSEIQETIAKTKQAFRDQAVKQCVGRRITKDARQCLEAANTAEQIVKECFD